MENVTLFFVTLFLKSPKTELHPTTKKDTNNFGCCKDKAEIKEKNAQFDPKNAPITLKI